METKRKNDWWKDGVKFQCQQSGNCCVSHGEYGYVYLTQQDRRNMAGVLKMSTSSFTRKYCTKTDGVYHLKEEEDACTFLKNRKCTVYSARPMQCRTWPFWPETMSPKAWRQDVVNFCPGVGKGSLIPATEIKKQIDDQQTWENELVDEV